MGGNFFTCPATDWYATGRKKLFTNYAFSFPWVAIYSKSFKLYLFLHSSIMSTPTKAKRNTWSTAEKNNFLLLCRAEGNSRPPRQLLDCHCYGQHSHENESRAEIRRKPFIQAVFVLDKTCSYKWYSSRLIFSCINGPIKKSPSTLHFDKFGKVWKFNKKNMFLFAKLLKISTIFKEAVKAHKSSFWHDDHCTCIYQLLKALRPHKNVSQNIFWKTVFGFHCLHLDCVLFWWSK